MIWPLPAPILCFGHASFTPPSKIFSWFIEPCFSHDPHPFHQTTHLFIEPCFSIGPHPFHQTTNLFIQPCFFSLGYGLISSVVRSFVVSLKYTSHFFFMNHVFHITHIPSTKPPICLLNRAFHMTHTPSTKPPTCLLNHAFHMTHTPSTKPPTCLLNHVFQLAHTPSTKPPTCLFNHVFFPWGMA